MIGAFGMIFGQASYNGALGGARNMTERERAQIESQMNAATSAFEAYRRDMHRMDVAFRRALRAARPTPPLQIPEREPVPSLCCLNGRWL